jgi:hypothetical protein
MRKEVGRRRCYCRLTAYFVAEYIPGSIFIDEDETIEAKWFDELPQNAFQRLAETPQCIECL